MVYLRVADHQLEVVVGVDAGAHVFVVVLELFDRDNLVTLVRLPDSHEVGEDLIGCLAAALEVWMETDIVGDSDVVNRHLARAILVKDAVGLMDHIKTTLVKRAANGAQKLVKGQLAILVSIEVLDDLSNFNLREVHAVVAHGILEFNGAKTAVTVSVHGAEHGSETSKSIGASLFAEVNHLLLDLLKIADLHVLLHVWVSNVEVTALRASKIDCCFLLLEVNVAFVADHSLSLVERLGHTAGTGKGIWTCRGAHVRVLSLQCLSVNSNGSGLSVITLRNSISKLCVSSLGSASEHACLDDELIVTVLTSDKLAILSLHDLATYCVCGHVLGNQILTICGVEVTLLIPGINILLSFSHLLHHLPLNLTLHLSIFAADSSHTVGLVLASAVFSVVRVEELLVGLSIDPVVGVIKHFTLDGVLEVVVLLRDVRLSHSSKS